MQKIERIKGKNIIKCDNGGTWNFREWKEKRIYFSNDHYAVGASRISFFWDIEAGKFNKTFPALAEEQNDIKAVILAGNLNLDD